MSTEDKDTRVFARKFVNEVELGEIVGLSPRTLQKHRLEGHGPKFYKLHGAVRYALDDIEGWIKASAGGGDQECSAR